MKILVTVGRFNFGGIPVGQEKINIPFTWGNNAAIYEDSDQATVDYSTVTTKAELTTVVQAAIKAKIESSPKMSGQTATLILFP